MTKRFNWEFGQIREVFSQDPLDSKDELCFMDGCYKVARFTMASALGEIGGSMTLLVCGDCAKKLKKAKWGRNRGA